MGAEPEPWIAAVAAVLGQFTVYSAARMESGDLEACRRKARVSPPVADLFEDALNEICPDETEDDEDITEDEAAPAATGTAGRTAS